MKMQRYEPICRLNIGLTNCSNRRTRFVRCNVALIYWIQNTIKREEEQAIFGLAAGERERKREQARVYRENEEMKQAKVCLLFWFSGNREKRKKRKTRERDNQRERERDGGDLPWRNRVGSSNNEPTQAAQ